MDVNSAFISEQSEIVRNRQTKIMAEENGTNADRNCFYCGLETQDLFPCKNCDAILACSEKHMRIHKPVGIVNKVGYKTGFGPGSCFAFTVKHSEVFGRFLVANRDIQSGESIFIDFPFAFGPLSKSAATCLGCFKLVKLMPGPTDEEPHLNRCPECQLPLCEDCKQV